MSLPRRSSRRINARAPRALQSSRAAGFSIVEVLVGMTIGLIGMIIMMQVFVAAEGNKRNTTGTDDAQNNGSVALYGLQTEMRHAGYGISAFNLLN